MSIVVVIVLVAGWALWRERSRMSGLEQWMTGRGFTRRFPVPTEGPEPATRLVARMSTYRARNWGLVLQGAIDGVPVVVGEHESSVPGKREGLWHTMVMWPDATVRELDESPHGGSLVRDDGYCAWRVRGNITAERMEALLAEFATVHRLLP